MSLQIRPLSYPLGVEILGVNFDRPLADATFEQIHAAFLKYSVILFRGQTITREQHIAFARRFGDISNNDEAPRDRIPEYPELQPVTNQLKQRGASPLREAMLWHSDRTYMCITATGTALRAVDVPAVGGDTAFANMYLAYEALSDGMKKLIAGLDGIHPGGHRRIDISTPEREAETKRLCLPIAHPLVRVHPETRRKCLFITEKVIQLVGLTADESRPLIDFLCRHATRPQFVYRHQWQKDDLLMWDNRCTLHRALYDFDNSEQRYLEKTTGLMNEPCGGYVYEGTVNELTMLSSAESRRDAIWKRREL